MAYYRKRPVEVEAIQYTAEACREIHEWLGIDHNDEGDCEVDPIFIETLEGVMAASPGDWIIKGVRGEFYPCKPDIFRATYERVE